VGSGNCFKVGKTKQACETRKGQLSVGSPDKLSLFREIETEYPDKLENHIHKRLDHSRAENGEFFRVTERELDEAIEDAKSYLAVAMPQIAKADELAQTRPDDEILTPSPEVTALFNELRKTRTEEFLVQRKIELLKAQLKVAIGGHLGLRDIAKWQWQGRLELDEKLFKAEQPELYQKYSQCRASRFFRLQR
jgi:hypothetical protein